MKAALCLRVMVTQLRSLLSSVVRLPDARSEELTQSWPESGERLLIIYFRVSFRRLGPGGTWKLGYIYEKTCGEGKGRKKWGKGRGAWKKTKIPKTWISHSKWYKTNGKYQDDPDQFKRKSRVIRLFHKVCPERIEIEKMLGELELEGWPNCHGRELNLPEGGRMT